jgi:hypothetical protein
MALGVAIALAVSGLYLVGCGGYQTLYGQNLPGRWAQRGFLPRGVVAPNWKPSEWRVNGKRLLVSGAVLFSAGVFIWLLPMLVKGQRGVDDWASQLLVLPGVVLGYLLLRTVRRRNS